MNCGLESTCGKVWNITTKIAGPEEMEPERVYDKIGRVYGESGGGEESRERRGRMKCEGKRSEGLFLVWFYTSKPQSLLDVNNSIIKP